MVHLVGHSPEDVESLLSSLRSLHLHAVTYEDGEGFLKEYEPHPPECLLLEVSAPGLDGLDLQLHLRSEGYDPPVVFASGRVLVPQVVQAMKQGALDVLQKPVPRAQLEEAVREALEVSGSRRRALRGRGESRERLALLSTREREVLDRVVRGRPSKVIAQELGLSKKTVDAHRSSIMKKLRADSVADLVRRIVEMGLT